MTSPASSTKVPAAAIGSVVLFSLFPVLSLLSSNTGQVDLTSSVRSAALIVAASLLLLVGARFALRDWSRAALLVAGTLLLFFSYGHVYDLVRRVEIGGVLVGRHRFLAPLWGLAGVAWLWVVVRMGARVSLRWLLVLGALLAVLPISSLVVWGVRAALAAEPHATANDAAAGEPSSRALPDIYYIILDAYGREDVLADLYGIDNRGFVQALEQRGFYVADESLTNYSLTLQSLASTLNMRYLDDLAAEMGPGATTRAPLEQMVKHSEVRRILEAMGYQTVAFETGYASTAIRDADFYHKPGTGDEFDLTPISISALPINEFEGLLAKTSALRPLIDDLARRQDLAVQLLSYPYQRHRMRVIYTLETVSVAARMDGPQFVFAHIVCPHTPFVFGQGGEQLVPSGIFTLEDAEDAPQGYYIDGYTGQVQALNALVLEALDAILAAPGNEPVIILQGDHGPGAYLDLEEPMLSNHRERQSILNAYYLPSQAQAKLYPSITPVNTFRVVLGSLFGQDLALLPDESYVAPWKYPYAFTRVTEAAKGP